MKRRSRFTSFQSTYSTRSVTSRLIFFLALRALSLFLVRTGLAIRRAPQRGRSRRGRGLGPAGHEAAGQVPVLRVDVLAPLGDQQADLLLGPAGVVLVLGAYGLGHQKGSSAGS